VPGSDPYTWPYDGDLSPGRLALVVAGAQIAFAHRSQRSQPVGATIERLADAFRTQGALVVFVRHHGCGRPLAARPLVERRRRRPVTLPPVRGTAEWQLALATEPSDVVVDAGGVDGFLDSGLDATLRSLAIDHLCLAGFAGELAVDSTLRSANDRGYECLVVTDAVAPIDVGTGARSLSSVTMSGGIFGALGTSEALLEALTLQGVT
jgi:nicotinamidase-related amidase